MDVAASGDGAPVMRPAGVLFDAGGTLIQPNVRRLAAGLAEIGQRGHRGRADHVDHVDHVDEDGLDAALWRAMALFDSDYGPEAGDPSRWRPAWLERFGREAGVPGEVMTQAWQIVDGERHVWDQPIDGARECLDRLRHAGVRVGVVSNSDGRVAGALDRAGLVDRLDIIVDSGVVGVAKPDPLIFDHALEPLGLKASETWYIGDTVAYDVAAADAAGLTSWVIDHRGLHTRAHARRVFSLAAFADRVLSGPPPGEAAG
jgi:putative hydrolase of the HAD superfamily